ncbi:NTP transferase domain-containing protein [Novosphingobium sp. 9]|uniref:nucleotidyltransferase family protein n=1 Tax=Novosphingobium sp. 9 TaxID=2025349 RepID=UPI0021B65D9D|nr:nucleotidyltransferase family protein [Novosphingobium sp. 9]
MAGNRLGSRHDFGAIVLAAGHATRFGGGKMHALFRGEPLLHHAIRLARAAPVSRVVVVTRPGAAIGQWDGAPPVTHITLASDALSTTLRAGLAEFDGSGVDGAFVFLGDMPLVPRDMAARLAAALGERYAALPVVGERPGHPVLLSARAMADALLLEGDAGAGRLLRARPDVLRLPCDDPGVLTDIDSREDLVRVETER